MLSVVSSYAGRRDLPAEIDSSIASSTVASASIATMSGRGSMTSRTTVSPNSKIEWMSSRSSVSIDDSLAATSAIVRISSSVTNGPPRRPLPGITMLASPMNMRVSTRSGGKRVTNANSADTIERGALRVLHRERLRRDLREREHDDDFDEHPDREAERAVAGLEHGSDQRRGDEVAAEEQQQHAVQRPLRMVEQPDQSIGALVALVAKIHQADATDAYERSLGEGENRRERPQREDDGDRHGGAVHRAAASVIGATVSGCGPLRTGFSRSPRGRGTGRAAPARAFASPRSRSVRRGRSPEDAGRRAPPTARARRQ